MVLFPSKYPLKQSRPQWIIPLAVVLATLMLASVLGYRYWISTPQYSLLQAKSAFEAHDLGKFEKYVAIDLCADTFTDDLMTQATAKLQTQTQSDTNPFAQASRKIAEGLLTVLKPAISTVIKTKTRELVSTGQITPSAGQNSTSTGPVDLEQIKNNIKSDGLHFDGLGNVGVENNTATVELRFHNEKKNLDQLLELEMRRVEGYWQVARWKNAAQWMKQASANSTATAP